GDSWPAPAPPAGAGSVLSVFNGTIPTGTWSVYVVDDTAGNSGLINGGWTLSLTTQCVPTFAQGSGDGGPPTDKPPVAGSPTASPSAQTSTSTHPPAAQPAG